jgi:hypothetical protein
VDFDEVVFVLRRGKHVVLHEDDLRKNRAVCVRSVWEDEVRWERFSLRCDSAVHDGDLLEVLLGNLDCDTDNGGHGVSFLVGSFTITHVIPAKT